MIYLTKPDVNESTSAKKRDIVVHKVRFAVKVPMRAPLDKAQRIVKRKIMLVSKDKHSNVET